MDDPKIDVWEVRPARNSTLVCFVTDDLDLVMEEVAGLMEGEHEEIKITARSMPQSEFLSILEN